MNATNLPNQANMQNMLRTIIVVCGAIGLGVVLVVLLIFNNDSNQREREARQILSDRIGSCNQYNQQIVKTIRNDRLLAEAAAESLIRISGSGGTAIAKAYVLDQGNSAEITSRENNLFRNCTKEGIAKFLQLQTSVSCAGDKDNPGFCLVEIPSQLIPTTTVPLG